MNVRMQKPTPSVVVWRPDLLRVGRQMVPLWAKRVKSLKLGRQYKVHDASPEGVWGRLQVTNDLGLRVWVSARGFCLLSENAETANTVADRRLGVAR